MPALVTMYAGEAEILRDVTLPTFERYADRHGFDLVEAEPVDGLPAAWGKVAVLRDALADHPLAVWIDADAVVFDSAPNLAEWMPGAAHQMFATHRNLEYGINTWLWGVRDTPEGLSMLDRVWGYSDRYTAPPWELSAVHAVMGEHPEHQLGFVQLPGGWHSPDGHFLHWSSGGIPTYAERATRLSAALIEREGASQAPSSCRVSA